MNRRLIAIISLLIMMIPAYLFLKPFWSSNEPAHPEIQKHAPTSIGFVDVQKVFNESTQGKAQIAQFQRQLNAKSTEVKTLNNKVNALRSRIQALASHGNARAAQALIPSFQAVQQRLAESQQKANGELQQVTNTTSNTYMTQLKPVMEDLRKSEHLDAIVALDAAKTLAYDPTLDLTEKALAAYNQRYSTSEAPAAKP